MQSDSLMTSCFRFGLSCLALCLAGCSEDLLNPRSLPTPTPAPSPTPLPVVIPIPTATPTPIPTPTPTYREAKYNDFRRDLQVATLEAVKRLEQENAETYPRIQIGDTAVIRTRGGLQIEGRLQYIVKGDVMIATSTGSRTFKADDLDAFTRLRLDGGFRTQIIGAEAAYESFYNLSQQYDLERFDLEGTLPEAERADMGQPGPLLAQAERAVEEGRGPEAFHLNRILAEYGHASAKRNLALMYFQGEVIERDIRQGEALLMDAAEQGDDKAVELLAEWRRRMEESAAQAQQEKESAPKYKTVYVSATCPHCGGKGYRTPGFSNSVGSKQLPCKCGGTGKIRVPRSVKVN